MKQSTWYQCPSQGAVLGGLDLWGWPILASSSGRACLSHARTYGCCVCVHVLFTKKFPHQKTAQWGEKVNAKCAELIPRKSSHITKENRNKEASQEHAGGHGRVKGQPTTHTVHPSAPWGQPQRKGIGLNCITWLISAAPVWV